MAGKRFRVGSQAAAYFHIIPNSENKDYYLLQGHPKEISLHRLTSGGNDPSAGIHEGIGVVGVLQKIQSYEVDHSLIDSASVMDLKSYHELFQDIRTRSFSLALDLGTNTSIWLIGRHISSDYGDLLFRNTNNPLEYVDYFTKTLSDLHSALQSHTKSLLRLKSSLRIKCYEVYADQIRDLFSLDETSNPPTIRENKTAPAPFVDSLVEMECATAEQAYSLLHAAYHRRSTLIVEHLGTLMNSTQQILGRSLVGYVGNVFIHLQITQTLCPTASCTSAPGSPLTSELIQRTGVIQFNILADPDSLSYKPSKSENLVVLPLQQISSENGFALIPGNPVIVSENQLPNNSRLVSQQLLSAAKASSTLSRVINKLYQRERQHNSSTSSGSGSGSGLTPSHHISYRDSVLTRVLQVSFEGNFANNICLFLDIRKHRFNSEINSSSVLSCTNSLRLLTELQGATKTASMFLRSSDRRVPLTQEELLQSVPQLFSSTATKDSEGEERSSIEAMSADELLSEKGPGESNSQDKQERPDVQSLFWNLLNSLRDDSSLSSAISDLLSLEDERDSILQRLGGQRLEEDASLPSSSTILTEAQPSFPIPFPLKEGHSDSRLTGTQTLPPLKQSPSRGKIARSHSSQSNPMSSDRTHTHLQHQGALEPIAQTLTQTQASLVTPPTSAKFRSRATDSETRNHSNDSKDTLPKSSNLKKIVSPSRPSTLPLPKKPQNSPLSKISSPAHLRRISSEAPSGYSSSATEGGLTFGQSTEMPLSKISISTQSSFASSDLPVAHSPPHPPSPHIHFPVSSSVHTSATERVSHGHDHSSEEKEERVSKKRESGVGGTSHTHFPRVKGAKDYFDNDDGPGNEQGLSALEIQFLKAVSNSNLALVRHCINEGVNLGVKNSFGRDAVQISTRNGSLDILTTLFEAGASLTTRGKRGDTLFHLAAANGHVSLMEWLTSVGVMHDVVDLTGQTCAHVAARRGEVEVLRYLESKHEIDFNQKDFDDHTPLEKIPKSSLLGNEKELEETRLFLLSRREEGAGEEES